MKKLLDFEQKSMLLAARNDDGRSPFTEIRKQIVCTYKHHGSYNKIIYCLHMISCREKANELKASRANHLNNMQIRFCALRAA